MKIPPKKQPERIIVEQVQFLGEQDGATEQILKDKLLDFFQRDRSVRTAYLARVRLGNPLETGVALCLKTQFGADPGMAEKIGRIFSSIFAPHAHLDIIFVDEAEEIKLVKVCRPFFSIS